MIFDSNHLDINDLPVGAFKLQRGSGELLANQKLINLLQLSSSDELRSHPASFYLVDIRKILRDLNRRGSLKNRHIRLRRADSSLIEAKLTVSVNQTENSTFLCGFVTEQPEPDLLDPYYRNLFEKNKAVLLLINKDNGSIFNANDAAVSFYGYSKERLLSMNVADINTMNKAEIQLEMQRAAVEQRDHFYFEHRLSDGSTREVEVHSGPIPWGETTLLYSIIHDVSHEKEIERRLLDSNERLDLVIQAGRLGYFVWDIRENTLTVSEKFKEIAGLDSAQEVDHLAWQSWLHSDYLDFLEKWERFIESRDSRFETETALKSGEKTLRVKIKAITQYDKYGHKQRIVGTLLDITAEKELNERLKAAREQAEETARLKSSFLSVLSHEIRTPMNSIIGAVNLLMAEKPRIDQMKYMNLLKNAGDNLLHLINEILDFQKLSEGRKVINNEIFQVRDVVSELSEQVRTTLSQSTEKKIDFSATVGVKVPDYVRGERTRLLHILQNLLSNAVKFTFSGSVRLAVQLESESGSDCILRFIISDTGIGISQKHLKLIFDPFRQVESRSNRHFEGTGLGLAIARGMLHEIGGDVQVESEEGKGSCFSVRLPLKIVRKKEQVSKSPEKMTGAATPENKLSLLVVDDSVDNLFIAERFLKKFGYNCDTARSGYEAVDKVKNTDYDIILMDLLMPGIDGFETTEKIHEISENIRVIAMTADTLSEKSRRLEESGIIDFLAKPFAPGDLKKVITRNLPQEA